MLSDASSAPALAVVARLVYRYRVALPLFWAILVAVLLPEARRAASRLEVGNRVSGSPAASVEADLARRFHSAFAQRVLLVVDGVPDPAEARGRAALSRIVARITASPGVTGTLSYLDSEDPIFRGRGSGSFVIVGLSAGERAESLIPPLRRATRSLQADLRRDHPGAELGWTGEIPLNLDLRGLSSRDADAAEKRALPVALLLLVAVFGSPVAALLPLLVGSLSVLLTLAGSGILARFWNLSILVQNIASMIGLGLGIDYALLMVNRWRESSNAGRSVASTVEETMKTGGRTLLLSALPVGIGFAALTVIPTSEFRSIGVAGILVTLFTLLIALTLLPALLALLGPRLEIGRIFRGRTPQMQSSSERWRRWGDRIVARPWTALLLGGAPLLILASGALRLETGTLKGDWLPNRAESVRALHHLEEMGRGNVVQVLRVLLELPSDSPLVSESGWMAARRFARALEEDPGVERVHSVASLAGPGATPRRLRSLPRGAWESLVSRDEHCLLFEVLPATRSSDPIRLRADAEDLARRLRAVDASVVTGVAGISLRVGGLPAANAEFEDVITARSRRVLLAVVVATLLGLFAGFRSVLVAVKAVLLNLLSVSAAFGALVLVFQEGHGAALFGLSGPTGRVFTIVPVLVFCIVFGLSMDYEVFLVSRVAEARRGSLDEGAAIAEGLARTGSVITSAASIMVAVFAAFSLGAFLPVQMLGFALAVAVLLDAAVVRTVVGPALLRLAGRWNWWPGWRRPTAPEGRLP